MHGQGEMKLTCIQTGMCYNKQMDDIPNTLFVINTTKLICGLMLFIDFCFGYFFLCCSESHTNKQLLQLQIIDSEIPLESA